MDPIFKKDPAGIPRLSGDELRKLRDAEKHIDAKLNEGGGTYTSVVIGVGLAAMTRRSLLAMYRRAGYAVEETGETVTIRYPTQRWN